MSRPVVIALIAVGVSMAYCGHAMAQGALPVPALQVGIGDADDPQQVALTLKIVFALTVLSLAPSIMILMTSFTRIIIIFSFARMALHTQQMPSRQILAGLALFLTFYIMTPVWNKINDNALQPYLDEQISFQEGLKRASLPLREFMLKHTREKDLALFVSLGNGQRPNNKDDLAFTTVVPAFVVSEVTTAFTIGFLLYLPFLIIDMVIACVLLSMGMMMLPPVMVSLPFKLLLFVLVDGWNLLIGSVVKSFY